MSITRRSGRLLAIAVLGAVALAVTATVPATAAPAHRPAPPAWSRGEYLALGDSVAFGYRPPEVTPPSAYLNAANFVGYPEDLGRFTGLKVTNLSCPGETTASMINVTAQSNGCENAVGSPVGYRTEFPLHTNYSGDQLDYAVQFLRTHRDTKLVTIDIGANDGFVCQTLHGGTCTGANLTATLEQVGANLTTIYAALRDKAHYQGPLVLVSYYSTDYADPTATEGSVALNTVLSAVTAKFGGIVANGFGAFELASLPFKGDTCAAGLLVKLPDGTCNIHPSAYGHLVLASAIGVAVAGHRHW